MLDMRMIISKLFSHSPKHHFRLKVLPAIGVAALYGFTPNRREARITNTITKPKAKLAIEAVTTEAAQSKRPWEKSIRFSGNQSMKMANVDAISPTIIACT